MLLDPNSVKRGKSTKEATIFVSGQRIDEGTLTDMKKRFDGEVAMHHARVEVRLNNPDGTSRTKHLRKQVTVIGGTRF